MFGIIILLCVAVTFGFCLAWICGMVAKTEIEVKTGVVIVALSTIAAIFTRYLIASGDAHPLLVLLGGAAVGWVCVAGLLVSYAKITWKLGAIVASVYTVVEFVASLLVAMIISD
ncbi:MAG TPA: hypothetical protein VEB22_02250 [Phycisphaerales bacterium]|nr:hypothetical protein [Phycisphaerales bacterium]